MNHNDCIEKGMLRKTSVSQGEVQHQIQIAADYLRKAGLVCKKETFDISFLCSYISIFHSARALLYSKGYKERSHFCLFEFIREEFKDCKEILRLAEIGQNYRETRHMIQYDGALCSEAGANEAINDAGNFLVTVKKKI